MLIYENSSFTTIKDGEQFMEKHFANKSTAHNIDPIFQIGKATKT